MNLLEATISDALADMGLHDVDPGTVEYVGMQVNSYYLNEGWVPPHKRNPDGSLSYDALVEQFEEMGFNTSNSEKLAETLEQLGMKVFNG